MINDKSSISRPSIKAIDGLHKKEFRNNPILIFIESKTAMTLIAILLPWLSFLLRGKLISGIVCLILQITLIGWLPAAVWAVISLQNARADRRARRMVRSMQHAH